MFGHEVGELLVGSLALPVGLQQIVQVLDRTRARVRVWERGVGPTLASGSSSCATAVAAHRRGLTGRKVQIDLDGGTLWIEWAENGPEASVIPKPHPHGKRGAPTE